MEAVKIRKELLEYLLALARSAFPNEFAGFLREKDGILEEVLIAPRQYAGRDSVFFDPWMLPHDDTIKGTVHSHPSPVSQPSMADLRFFSKFGGIHLIIFWPFTMSDVKAYTSRGEEIPIIVIE